MARNPSVQWKFVEFFDSQWAWQRLRNGSKVNAKSRTVFSSYGQAVRDAVKAGFSPKKQDYAVTNRCGFTTSHPAESPLQMSLRHVLEFEQRVAEQAGRIELLKNHDWDPQLAENLLSTMECSLRLAWEHWDREEARVHRLPVANIEQDVSSVAEAASQMRCGPSDER